MPPFTHTGGVDAEALYRYEPGGYHPLQLGETLKNGRYKIIHKLGWGGFSTIWAARDQRDDCYVAVKIKVADAKHNRELDILRALSCLPKHHPGSSHINRMLDHFTLVGPNGSHDCLVLELVGPSVSDVASNDCKGRRLPAKLMKHVARQALLGIDFLSVNGIAHGDLHTRNIALVVPGLQSLSEEDFVARLGKPETGVVTRVDGGPLGKDVPAQMTQSASSWGLDDMPSRPSVKIIDFGEAFFDNNAPTSLNTPISVRPPEVVFGDRLDRRVDFWGAGCLIFELITGQPPFDAIMQTPPLLVEQMLEELSDELPSRWQAQWEVMQKDIAERRAEQQTPPEDSFPEDDIYTLHEWLEECYNCCDEKMAEFTKEELASMATAIGSMMRFEPSLRATPREMLAHDMFREGTSSRSTNETQQM
ncbi:hypothetical protein FPOAC1_009919 [Fusarium poae]|nr:hypothetical protein FPOAC1_009919 [Fusarium poae]KAG8670498.1 hypothetical protein FPOAC1_009919 [Fusarium poae]